MSQAPNTDDERTRLVDDRTRIADPAGSATMIVTPTMVKGAAAADAARSSASHNAFEVGTKIGEFEILGLVGEGGFGIVYLAYDHSLDRKVALKEYMPSQLAHREEDGKTVVMRSDRHAETFAAGMRSFINEARLLAQFDHHSLVKVYRFWEANGTAYMVMPFYEGTTLKQALKELGGPPDEHWLKKLLAPLLDALETIHNRQCFHRDIAPDNILIQPDGAPLLLDFGAARRVIGDMTQALTVILKPGYAPIEQYAEVPDLKQGAWTDIYALASVMYLAITGKAPVPSVARVMSDPVAPLTKSQAGKYSEGLLRALDWALTVKPESRPQSVAEFREAVGLKKRERDAVGNTLQPSPAVAGVRAPEALPKGASPGGGKKIAAIAAGVIAVAAVGGYFAYTSGRSSPDAPPPATTAAAIAETAPPPDTSPLASQVKAKLAGFECARLDATVDGGTAVVRGHVTAEADLQKLRADVAGVNGVSRVDDSGVQIVPPSYCGIVSTLAPYVQSSSALPRIGLKSGKLAAAEGDKLIADLSAANFAGFVYADLFDPEGNVVHLLPNPREKKNELKPKERITIGEDAVFGMQWDIVPPFGKHLLVVTTAKSPLFSKERPEVEPAYKYVSAVQEAAKKLQPQDVAANYQFVEFGPKK